MKSASVAITFFLLAGFCANLSATPPSGALAEPLAPISCEVVDKAPVNGEVRLLLHVQAGECIESVGVTWYSWTAYATSDTVTMQQAVSDADSVTFPIVMRIPEANAEGCILTVRTLHKKVPMKEPCFHVSHYVDRWGKPHTSRREVSIEDEEAVKRLTFRITDSLVYQTYGMVTGDYTPQVPDTSAYYTPWLHTPAESVRTPMSKPRKPNTPPRELTDEEKRKVDSLLGRTAPPTEVDRPVERVLHRKPVSPETMFQIVLWLDGSADLEFARKQLDSLTLTDEKDCYITKASTEVIRRLKENGIKIGSVTPLPTK